MSMIKQGVATGAAARKTFAKNRQAHGFFGAVGAMGRKAGSNPGTKALARSGKMRSAAVVGGMAGISAMGTRRGSGTGKRTPGRPTGMYGY
jgi:hypothetical protein